MLYLASCEWSSRWKLQLPWGIFVYIWSSLPSNKVGRYRCRYGSVLALGSENMCMVHLKMLQKLTGVSLLIMRTPLKCCIYRPRQNEVFMSSFMSKWAVSSFSTCLHSDGVPIRFKSSTQPQSHIRRFAIMWKCKAMMGRVGIHVRSRNLGEGDTTFGQLAWGYKVLCWFWDRETSRVRDWGV